MFSIITHPKKNPDTKNNSKRNSTAFVLDRADFALSPVRTLCGPGHEDLEADETGLWC